MRFDTPHRLICTHLAPALCVTLGCLLPRAVAADAPVPTMFVREYRVQGATELPRIQIEEAVYPFLGPGRTAADVESARAALEKAYQDAGYKTAQVAVPDQTGVGGVIALKVHIGKVGELRVKGARYFQPSRIKAAAQSLAEGKVINFNNVTRDIVALNQLPERRVEPKLTPSDEPGVYDIDLLVKDRSPFHGSVELNNRNSANTTDLRLNASLSYANLWQRGHSIGLSYQTSPEDTSEVKVLSGYYIWRFAETDAFSLMFTGTKQDSNVSTLGSVAVAGRGEILGMRGIFALPTLPGFYQSFTLGLDYKHFDQAVQIGTTTDLSPISYYPVSATWDGTWLHTKKDGEKSIETGVTALTAGITFGLRGTGSTRSSLDRNRFGADGNFIYFRGDLSHTQQLGRGWELMGKIQGQAADQPLVNSEQFGGGGMGTVRGYLEAEALGDNAVLGTLELRTPSLLRTTLPESEEKSGNEWRFYAFADGGSLTLHDVLPEQRSSYRLASFGIGSNFQLKQHFNGVLELALPLTALTTTEAHEPRVSFRLWADF